MFMPIPRLIEAEEAHRSRRRNINYNVLFLNKHVASRIEGRRIVIDANFRLRYLTEWGSWDLEDSNLQITGSDIQVANLRAMIQYTNALIAAHRSFFS